MKSVNEIEQEARRVLSRLAQPRTVLAVVGTHAYGVFSARNGWKRAVLQTKNDFVEAFTAREFLVAVADDHPGAKAGRRHDWT